MGLNGSLTAVNRQLEKIQGNYDTLAATISLTEEDSEKQLYNEIRLEPFGPLSADTIFSDLSKESDKNHTTIAKKVCDMACSSPSKNTLTMTVASNALVKIGIKGSVSTLCRDSQSPEDAPMLMHGTTPFFS